MKIASVMPPRPVVENWSQRGLVILREPLSIATDAGLMLHCPRWLHSDGASVPAALWFVLSDEATPLRLLTMGLAHDAAYRSDCSWTLRDGSLRPIARPEADDLAEALALWSGAAWLDGRKIRYGLGVGGGGSWHQKRLDWRPAP